MSFFQSRYDDRDFKNLSIDHDDVIRSLKNIEQYTILKRLISYKNQYRESLNQKPLQKEYYAKTYCLSNHDDIYKIHELLLSA